MLATLGLAGEGEEITCRVWVVFASPEGRLGAGEAAADSAAEHRCCDSTNAEGQKIIVINQPKKKRDFANVRCEMNIKKSK